MRKAPSEKGIFGGIGANSLSALDQFVDREEDMTLAVVAVEAEVGGAEVAVPTEVGAEVAAAQAVAQVTASMEEMNIRVPVTFPTK